MRGFGYAFCAEATAVTTAASPPSGGTDCGSKNGTFVNEERVAGRAQLHDGDAIRLGRAELCFRAFQYEEGTETEREH